MDQKAPERLETPDRQKAPDQTPNQPTNTGDYREVVETENTNKQTDGKSGESNDD